MILKAEIINTIKFFSKFIIRLASDSHVQPDFLSSYFWINEIFVNFRQKYLSIYINLILIQYFQTTSTTLEP